MDGTDGNGFCFPYDVLLDILRRLPCRVLANSRRVCRSWRNAVDAHNLLLPHYFPPDVFPGIFMNSYGCDDESSFFAPPAPCSGRPRGAHDKPFFRHPLFRHHWASVLHHCNGLLLLKDDDFGPYVCNPATVRCAHLPVPWHYNEGMFLAFDPAVSLHYEVFRLPGGKPQPDIKECKKVESTEPHQAAVFSEEKQPKIHVHVPTDVEPKDNVISMKVFSSQTGQLASREFVPGRCAPRHLYDMVTAPHPRGVKIWKAAEYWQGSLYVHCWNNTIMILHNTERVYDMAQLPGKAYDDREHDEYNLPKRSVLASYERGVHYVAIDKFQLHVWTLTESDDGQVAWMLAHEADLSPHNPKIQQWIQPRVMWDAVESSTTVFSLFEPLNIQAIVYEEDSQSNITDDVDGDDDYDDYDDDDEDDHDDDSDDDEEGIHEVNTFDGTIVVDVDGDANGHREGEPHEDKDGEFKTEEGSLYSWDSDRDNFIDQGETVTFQGDKEHGYYNIIGLHPHKDVVLLETYSGAVAYHYRTSRMQYLGQRLVRNQHSHGYGINAAFPYRSCYVDALPTNKLPYRYGGW